MHSAPKALAAIATICALATPALAALPAHAAVAPAEPMVKISRIYYDSPGPDRRFNLNGEYVAVKNTTRTRTIDLSGWTITDVERRRYRLDGSYRFNRGVFIRPGQTIFVRTGRGRDTPFAKYQGERMHVWDNSEGAAMLRTARGHRVDFCHYRDRYPSRHGGGFKDC